MKKLVIITFMLAGLGLAAFAQTTPDKVRPARVQVANTVHNAGSAGVGAAQQPIAKNQRKVAKAKAGVNAERSTPLKKDGTPDRRFKANKDAAQKTSAIYVKKNGAPDMRYKENRKKVR